MIPGFSPGSDFRGRIFGCGPFFVAPIPARPFFVNRCIGYTQAMSDTVPSAEAHRRTGRALPDTDAFADAISNGDRRMLARAITLVESTRADHRAAAEALLDRLLPQAGRALRVGISGTPGVGKSTFIEALGLHLVDSGQRLAVLAVDPTSARSGGSILGDKTRMELLSRRPEAFIRPSPAGRSLGGVARRTREALLRCDAAG